MFVMDAELFIKLGLAAIFGLIIGIERELQHKPLGLKTCLVISVASCLLTIISIEAAYNFPKTDKIMMDPMRLAAQIVSGVGFLGAGVILRRNNDVISGLTTAAMIWGASGLGIAVGAGYYMEALVAAVLILIGVELIPMIMRRIGPRGLRVKELRITLTLLENANLSKMIEEIKSKEIDVKHIRIRDTKSGPIIELHVMVGNKRMTTDVYEELHKIGGILHVDIESLKQ